MSALESLRSVRIGPFAVFDFAASFAGVYFMAPVVGVSREKALWLTVPLGVVSHVALGTKTPLTSMLIGPEQNHLAQAAVALMLVKGLS
jgi:hypothetical protein